MGPADDDAAICFYTLPSCWPIAAGQHAVSLFLLSTSAYLFLF
jgi:hypothetical protein